MSDNDIDYSDIPELDEAFFAQETIELPKPKDSITLRIDHEILQYFKNLGRGYQTKINAVLKAYIKSLSQNCLLCFKARRSDCEQQSLHVSK